MAKIVPLSPIDVRDRLVSLFENNSLIADNFENAIKRRDPGTAPPTANVLDLNTAVTLCLAVPGLGVVDDTLGEGGVGTDIKVIQLALLIYVWMPTEFKTLDGAEQIKQDCSDLCLLRTTQAVEAVRQYQSDPSPDSLWYKSEFARQATEQSRIQLNTTFHSPEGKYHLSITPVNFYCSVTRSVPSA